MIKNIKASEKSNIRYFVALVSSQINRTAIPLPPENINWDRIFYYAERCSLTEIVSSAVLSLPKKYKLSEDIIKKAMDIKGRGIVLDTNLQYEIEIVLQAFEKYKIRNCPLKGYFMKQEYPQTDFRTLSDFDILIDRQNIEKIEAIFKELGYSFVSYDDNQYHYEKKPFMFLEMHCTLVHEFELYYDLLKDQLDRTLKRDGYEYSRQMSIEDFYIFLLVHHSNHFRIAGLGIRMVLDIYIYYKNHCKEFDYEYLNTMLNKMKLDAFEKRIRGIAFSWFDNPEPLITFDQLETYVLLSGTLGTADTGVLISEETRNEKSRSKLGSVMSRIFPSYKIQKGRYRYLEKMPVLLPISWVQMWVRRIFIEKNVNINKGLKRLDYNEDDITYLKGVFTEVGFDNLGYSKKKQ